MHLPFDAGPYRMAMGLTAVPEAAWLEIDEKHADEVALRISLLAERRDAVFAAGPHTEAARAELLSVLAEHLAATYPEWFDLTGTRLHNRLAGTGCDLAAPDDDPLAVAARLVQEDLMLLHVTPEGPLLDSAILCFPARWRLGEKIGRTLMPVHATVPSYADRLGRPVDRFFGALKPGRLAVRLNWSLLEDPTLFQPTGHGRTTLNPSITPENAGAGLFLRVERQTFRRLPQSGAVVFGIHTHVTKLHQVTALPGEAARLAAAVRALPEEMTRYKSISPFRTAVLAYLDECAGGPA